MNALRFTLPEEGTYQVVVSVTDSGGATPITVDGTSSRRHRRRPADRHGRRPCARGRTRGVALLANSVVGSFTDGNTTATTADFMAVIDWGDGSATSLGTSSSTAAAALQRRGDTSTRSRAPSRPRSIVFDDGGSTVDAPGNVRVTDLATIGVAQTFTAVEGQDTGSIVLATYHRPQHAGATAADMTRLPSAAGATARPQRRGHARRQQYRRHLATKHRSSRSSAATSTPRKAAGLPVP